MLRSKENPIKEIDSPAFSSGFFNGESALQSDTYKCKTCLDSMKTKGYTIGKQAGNEYILGWKYSLQIRG